MRAGGIGTAKGFDCRDCGRPAWVWDHRYYSEPLVVEPVCGPCNRARGPALDIAKMITDLKAAGIEPRRPPVTHDGWLVAALDAFEYEQIMCALEQTRFNRTAAARLLGITFRALRYRMERLNIA
jgi:hypothetical protein